MHFESFHFNYNPNNHYYFLIDVSEFSADFLIIADGRILSLYKFQVSVITFGYTGGNRRCFSITLAGSGVQQKQFQRLLKSRHCCFRTKAFDNVYENIAKKFQQPESSQRHFAGHKILEVDASKQRNQPIQTDPLTTETLKRVQSILSGPHVGAFVK